MSNQPRPAAGFLDHPYLILVLTVAFWGGNVVAGKAAVGHVDPFVLIVLRWIGALLAILPFGWSALRRDWPMIRTRLPLLAFYGVVGFSTFNVLVYLAAYFTSGINNALDQVGINVLIMLGNFAIFQTPVKALQIVGVLVTILGVAVTATHGDLGRVLSLSLNFGDVLVLFACVAYAGYTLTLRYRPAIDWKSFLVVTFAFAAAAGIAFQLLWGGGLPVLFAAVPQITPLGWLIVLYTILFPSLVSQVLYVRGVELIGANRASIFINLIPLFGAIGSVLVLGEALQPFHLVAAGLIAVGIVLAEWSAGR